MGLTYAKAGVDTRKMRGVQQRIAEALQPTLDSSVLLGAGHYAGLVRLGERILALHTDGVGTKCLLAEELGRFDTVGIDAVAMNANDVICVGARPFALVDYLAVRQPDGEMIGEIMKGLAVGSKQAGCAVIGGETAVVPELISGGRKAFDLSATVLGAVEKGVITGDKIAVGDAIIGLESSGLHSNGFTLARKALKNEPKETKLEMLEPTAIYVNAVMEMISACDVHGLAHITGGAFSKLTRISADKGFLLDAMPEPSPLFNLISKRAGIRKREMYNTFNMGIGLCVVCPQEECDEVIRISRKHKTKAAVIGRMVKRKGVFLQGKASALKLA